MSSTNRKASRFTENVVLSNGVIFDIPVAAQCWFHRPKRHLLRIKPCIDCGQHFYDTSNANFHERCETCFRSDLDPLSETEVISRLNHNKTCPACFSVFLDRSTFNNRKYCTNCLLKHKSGYLMKQIKTSEYRHDPDADRRLREEEKILKYHGMGFQDRDICSITGYSSVRVIGTRQKHGLSRNDAFAMNDRYKLTDLTSEELCKYRYKYKFKLRKIARIFSTRFETVKKRGDKLHVQSHTGECFWDGDITQFLLKGVQKLSIVPTFQRPDHSFELDESNEFTYCESCGVVQHGPDGIPWLNIGDTVFTEREHFDTCAEARLLVILHS